MNELIARRMQKADLDVVVKLLADDEIGRSREDKAKVLHADYLRAFEQIHSDVNQYAAIFEINGDTIGCIVIIVNNNAVFFHHFPLRLVVTMKFRISDCHNVA